jgi:type VI secretion system protein ImpL
MKNLLVAIVGEGLFSLVALLVICAIVWFGGDYLGYPTRVRVVVILAVLAVWLVLYLVQRILAVRRAMRIEAMLRAQASAGPAAVPGAPLGALAHQFRLGVQALRATRSGKAAVQRMPWFLLLGPPGSGKTAAVRESGLNFPSVGLGHRTNPAAGGTRALDWWYAEQAVFLDTAGAFVTEPARHQEWLDLVRLLAGTGRARPIDGVVLVVSIAELLGLEEDRIGDHAQRLRDRIDELAARLGMTFPVHLVFSHCDRLHGFCDFFAHLPLEQRSQAWGCTFDWREADPQGLHALVEQEFQRLYQVLGQRRIESLAAANAGETTGDHQRNALLFPIQFALLQRRVGHYIAALTRPNPFQESGRLRGFWFTSATQGGEPIDRVMASIGLSGAALQPVQVAEQRAYFLNGPFAQLIPADHGLARTSAQALRRHRLVASVLALAALGAAGGAGWLLYDGYEQSETLLKGLAQDGHRLSTAVYASSEGAKVADELSAHLQRFDSHDGIPLALYPGLLLAGDLSQQARGSYVKKAAKPLIDSYAASLAADLGARLETKERSLEGYEQLEERFRVYRMLCGKLPLDRETVLRVLAGKGGGARVGDPAVAEAHLRYIVTSFPAQEWAAQTVPALDERVAHELRDALWIPLSGVEIAHAGAALYPPVDLAALLGDHRTEAFTLAQPVPGYFTKRAWDGFVAHAIEERAQALAKRFAVLKIDLDAPTIAQRLRARYEEEFAATWRALPAQVRMTPPRSLDEAIARLGELGHQGTPYRELIEAWQRQKTLPVVGLGDQAGAALKGAGKDGQADAKPNEWLDQALNAVGILHAALSQYASACPADARLANPAELDKAVAACAAFSVAAEAALAAYPDEEPRRAFIAHFRAIAEGARVALERGPLLEAVKPAPGLAMAITRDDLGRRLQSVGIPEFPQRWRELLAGLSAPPAADAAAAAARLAYLAGPQSPLALTLRAAWRGQKLKTQVVAAQGAATVDQEWIERSLKALGALAAAYAPAVDAEPGPRLARGDALKRVAEAFAATDRDLAAALTGIGDEALRALVARPFAQLQDDARHHLLALLAEDADQLWNERVRGRFAHDLAGAFPFSDTAQDADPKLVSAFLAPRAGALWDTERLLAAASAITVSGQPLLRFDPAYQRSLAAARALREALFAADAESPALSFAGELRQRAGVFQAVVEIGKEQLDLHDNPAARRVFGCALAEPLACRAAIQVAGGRWLEARGEPRPWSVLRWAAAAQPRQDGAGVLLTWSLSAPATAPDAAPAKPAPAKPAAPQSWLVQLAIEAGPAAGLFSRRLFDELAFPPTIAVRPQE